MLGQAKWIPGQLSFQALAPGQTAPFNFQPLIEAGLPLAPYVEHGSWRTGQPDIMRYGRDPYRGIMGLGRLKGNWCGTRATSGLGRIGYDSETGESWGGCMGMTPAQVLAENAKVARRNGWPKPWWGGDRMRRSKIRPRYRAVGMGDLLTDFACDRSQFAADWRNRFGEAMGTTLVVAVGAAAAAGVIGAITKKPLVGLIAGAIMGWMAHQSQIATYSDFLPRPP